MLCFVKPYNSRHLNKKKIFLVYRLTNPIDFPCSPVQQQIKLSSPNTKNFIRVYFVPHYTPKQLEQVVFSLNTYLTLLNDLQVELAYISL